MRVKDGQKVSVEGLINSLGEYSLDETIGFQDEKELGVFMTSADASKVPYATRMNDNGEMVFMTSSKDFERVRCFDGWFGMQTYHESEKRNLNEILKEIEKERAEDKENEMVRTKGRER
jgi:hypothetical protein